MRLKTVFHCWQSVSAAPVLFAFQRLKNDALAASSVQRAVAAAATAAAAEHANDVILGCRFELVAAASCSSV